MESILGLRPFVPAKDFEVSQRFYASLGFTPTHADDSIAILETGSFGFILQKYYVREWAENCMLQMLVRDVDVWWQTHDIATLADRFEVKAARPPAMQSWGMKVGFVFDPSGVLWHVTESAS